MTLIKATMDTLSLLAQTSASFFYCLRLLRQKGIKPNGIIKGMNRMPNRHRIMAKIINAT